MIGGQSFLCEPCAKKLREEALSKVRLVRSCCDCPFPAYGQYNVVGVNIVRNSLYECVFEKRELDDSYMVSITVPPPEWCPLRKEPLRLKLEE